MLNFKGNLTLLDQPLIMGILNVTPDSFFDGGKHEVAEQAVVFATQMLEQGAHIIDIGGCSTRPGSEMISEKEELARVMPVIELLMQEHPEVIISIDTFRSQVAREAVAAGAAMINDISAGSMDNALLPTVAELQVPYVLMHMQGTPGNMQNEPHYDNLLAEVSLFFSKKVRHLKMLGVNDIIIDPGFGFGKTVDHNYELLNHLDHFKIFQLPILAGISRKSMINKLLHTTPETALTGTIAANTLAIEKGASILRVHDVKQAAEANKIAHKVKNS